MRQAFASALACRPIDGVRLSYPHFPISSLLPHMESIFTVLFSDQPGSPAAIYGHKWTKPCRTVFYALNSHARAALVVFSGGHDQAIVFLFRLECTLLSWECDCRAGQRLSAAGRPKREHPDLQQTAHRCTSMVLQWEIAASQQSTWLPPWPREWRSGVQA
jgi:hypothetical protein